MSDSTGPSAPHSPNDAAATPKALHARAMEAADRADALRRAGDPEAARRAYMEAAEAERSAAERSKSQPSIAILHRSAAWLALEAEEPRLAERLACAALAREDTAPGFAEELRAVAEEARARIVGRLPPPGAASSVRIHLDGPEVQYGSIATALLHPRTDAVQTMLVRTAERRRRASFRRSGPPPRAILRALNLRTRARPGSMVVDVETGGDQQTMWDDNAELVREVVRGIALVHEDRLIELEQAIPDPLYRDNFIALARQLNPDGERLHTVDVVANTPTAPPVVVRLRPAARRPSGARGEGSGPGRAPGIGPLVGVLGEATSLRGNQISLVLDGSGRVRKVYVPEAMLNDVVQPYFGKRVRVLVEKLPKVKGEWLSTIEEAFGDEDGAEGG